MLRRPLAAALTVTALIATVVACGGDDDAAGDSSPTTSASVTDVSLVAASAPSVPAVELPASTPTELVTTVITEGSGTPAAEGDTVLVHYVGVRSADGAQFDTNFGSDPYPVTIGTGGVIPGWDEGLVGVTQGERLQLDIPNELAYGDQPRGEVIQAGDALSFVIDVDQVVPAADPALAVTAADIPTSSEMATEPSFEDARAGDGATLAMGDTGLFHLVAARRDDGTVLESTWDTMRPQPLVLDVDALPPGLATGLDGMQVGGRRVVVLPYDPDSGLTPETDVVVVADLLATY